MKFKNKGRKIYKTKEKNYYGKSPVGKAFSVGLTVLLIGGIVFIGYSVAEPLINYTKKKGDSTAESEMIATDTHLQTKTESLSQKRGQRRRFLSALKRTEPMHWTLLTSRTHSP